MNLILDSAPQENIKLFFRRHRQRTGHHPSSACGLLLLVLFIYCPGTRFLLCVFCLLASYDC